MSGSEAPAVVILHALAGTIAIAAFNVLTSAAFVGIGLIALRRFGLLRAHLESLFVCFWLGFAAVIAALLIWNMFFAVGPAVLPAVLSAGLISLLYHRRLVDWSEIRSLSRRTAAACLIAVIWVAHISTGSMTEWDTALYHMQGVEWARLYPAVPGVANVFGPMGFNNASFLYDAMLDTGPWRARAWHVANGLLVSAMICQVIVACHSFLNRKDGQRAHDLFTVLLMPAAINSVLAGRVSSFATVVPTALLVMVVSAHIYRTLSDDVSSDAKRGFDWFAAIALAAVAVAIKASAAVFAASVVALFLTIAVVRGRLSNPWRQRALVWSVAAVLVVGTSWAVRGVILSGYVFFPSPVLAAPVEWRVPLEHARAEYDFVVHSALATAENMTYVSGRATGVLPLIRHWLRVALEDLYEFAVPALALGLVVVAAAISRRRASAERRRKAAEGWWLLLPLGGALAIWSVTAPMPRYAEPFLWSLTALFGAQAFRFLDDDPTVRRKLLAGAVLCGLSPAVIAPAWSALVSRRATGPLTTIRQALVKVPSPGELFQAADNPLRLTTFTTDSGLILNVPTGPLGRCWSAPLPCTPNPAPNLRLRVPGRMDHGFVVDGDWKMRDWPEPWRPDLLPAMRRGWERRGH